MGNDSNSWRWSATGNTSETGYQNWYPGEPNYYGARELCVLMNTEGRWFDADCPRKIPFVCYNGKKNLVLLLFSISGLFACKHNLQHTQKLNHLA